ncbi:hypothetical protein BHM03_00049423, partial [Ensete ventricosum]
SASLAVRYDIVGPIATKQRKKKRKQSNGYSVDLLCVGRKQQHPRAFTSAAFAGPETAGANVPERWRGWRLGRRPGFCCSGERKDVKVAATVSALVGRSVLISLVPSVAEADVATIDGLELTIKSARDRKRWKLAAVENITDKRMEASAGLVAGSHNRNELVVIRRDGDMGPLQQLGGQICQICGDDVGLTVDGDLFVACNECASPIFRTCYEYERREGNLVCPQCKTRFKRLKGCPRVAGDEEEDDIDDLENEFNFVRGDKQDSQYIVEAMLQAHMSYGHQGDIIMPYVVHTAPQVPLLTNGEIVLVDYIPPEQHALVPSFMGGGGKRIHPLPFSDPNLPGIPDSALPIGYSTHVHLRSLYAYTQTYGYGSVAWKERMENWRQKQEKMHKTRNDGGGKGWSNDNKEPDLPL